MGKTTTFDNANSDVDSQLNKWLRLGKQDKSDVLLDVSSQNTEILNDLLSMSKKLKKAGKHKDAQTMLDIARKVLKNNEEVLAMVVALKNSGD